MGADVDLSINADRTSLRAAIEWDYVYVARILLEAGASNNGALHAAVETYPAMVKLLLLHGAEVDDAESTILLAARRVEEDKTFDDGSYILYSEDIDILQALLDNSANLNANTGPHREAFQLARRGEFLAEVNDLLMSKAEFWTDVFWSVLQKTYWLSGRHSWS